MTTPTLLHIHGTVLVGIWRLTDGTPVGYYPADPDHRHHTRAQLLLNARGDTVPWADWFQHLAERSPYLDNYILVDTDPQESLTEAYQHWHSQT